MWQKEWYLFNNALSLIPNRNITPLSYIFICCWAARRYNICSRATSTVVEHLQLCNIDTCTSTVEQHVQSYNINSRTWLSHTSAVVQHQQSYNVCSCAISTVIQHLQSYSIYSHTTSAVIRLQSYVYSRTMSTVVLCHLKRMSNLTRCFSDEATYDQMTFDLFRSSQYQYSVVCVEVFYLQTVNIMLVIHLQLYVQLILLNLI